MITYKESENMELSEIAYLYLISNLRLFNQHLEKMTLYRNKNRSGQIVSSITCYLAGKGKNFHTLYFRLYDDDYLWFLNSIAHDFPNVNLIDLSEESHVSETGGVQNDVQTSTEA